MWMHRAFLLFASLLIASCSAATSAPPSSPSAARPPDRPRTLAASGAPAVVAPAAPPSVAYGDAAAYRSGLDAFLDAHGRAWGPSHAFHGYVLVVDRGQVLYERSLAPAEPARTAPYTRDTRFRIGSVTKTFTAAAVLSLEEAGKLAVTDPVRKHLPDLPAAWDAVTLHHLLSHTSGIFSYTDDAALMRRRDRRATAAEVVATFRDRPLAFAPGTAYAYSNSNYFLLGLVIEKITGRSWGEVVQERVSGRLGLVATSADDAGGDAAVGATLDELGLLTPPGPIDLSIPFAAGALRSTASDMLAFRRLFTTDAVLGAASRARMTTPVKDDYGYGVMTIAAASPVYAHTGGIDGFSAMYAVVPARDAAVVVLCDVERQAPALANAALALLLDGAIPAPPIERKVMPVTVAQAQALAGEFALTEASASELGGKLPPGVLASIRRMSIALPAKKPPAGATHAAPLTLKPSGQGATPLFAGEGGEWFTKGGGITLTPATDAQGAIRQVTLVQGGLSAVYAPVAAPVPAPARRGGATVRPGTP